MSLRFILRRKTRERGNEMVTEDLFTVDVDVPRLEETLKQGGSDEYSYDRTELVGVEILVEG